MENAGIRGPAGATYQICKHALIASLVTQIPQVQNRYFNLFLVESL